MNNKHSSLVKATEPQRLHLQNLLTFCLFYEPAVLKSRPWGCFVSKNLDPEENKVKK